MSVISASGSRPKRVSEDSSAGLVAVLIVGPSEDMRARNDATRRSRPPAAGDFEHDDP
jgi:hypothetical protein